MVVLASPSPSAAVPPPPPPPPAQNAHTTLTFDAAARASELLSYKHCEADLREVAKETPCEGIEVRGNLEKLLTDADNAHAQSLPLVQHFLLALALAAGRCAGDGAALAAGLASNGVAASRPPQRSLVGRVHDAAGDCYDVALLRDREDGDRRFSVVLGVDRAKGTKIARVLAEVGADGAVYARGLHVAEAYRGRGLAALTLHAFAALCEKLGREARTLEMTKPLVCRALASLGFEPERKSWPVFVAPDPADAGRTLVCPRDPDDRRAYFSNALLQAQRLTLVAARPPNGREVFVKTPYRHPDRAALARDAREATRPTFYAARLLAFAATVSALRPGLAADDGGATLTER